MTVPSQARAAREVVREAVQGAGGRRPAAVVDGGFGAPDDSQQAALTAARATLAAGAVIIPLLRPGGSARLPRAVWAAVMRRAEFHLGGRAEFHLGGRDGAAGDTERLLARLVADGELVAEGGGQWLAPRAAPVVQEAAFHGDLLREALLAHWAEVRRWDLPAPDGERLVRLGREHLRLFAPGDVAGNSMARAALRAGLQARLRARARELEADALRVAPLLLVAAGAWGEGCGSLTDARLAERLETAVLAPDNVAAAAEAMVAAGLCARLDRPDGSRLYLDPELHEELQRTPERRTALRRLTGLAPAGSEEEASKVDVAGQVAVFERRLLTLQTLFDKGVITREELTARRGDILQEI